MAFSTDPGQIGEWAPLKNEGRPAGGTIAATRVAGGTDVDFGRITGALFEHLESQDSFQLSLGVQVKGLRRLPDTTGGHALPLLLGAGIPESKGYGGFPVGGMFLWCKNRDVVDRHAAKVYGNAKLGAPPMSVPHLDTRTINGKKQLFFGPYAGFSTRFLKNGSVLDLPASPRPGNVLPISAAGLKKINLTTYLIGQVLLSPAQRMEALREYFPDARDEDWELRKAGQRVQIIKRTKDVLGMIQFGTEVVTSADGSLAALLGASPGASTSASVVLDVIAACFPEQLESDRWRTALRRLIPSLGLSLADDNSSRTRLEGWPSGSRAQRRSGAALDGADPLIDERDALVVDDVGPQLGHPEVALALHGQRERRLRRVAGGDALIPAGGLPGVLAAGVHVLERHEVAQVHHGVIAEVAAGAVGVQVGPRPILQGAVAEGLDQRGEALGIADGLDEPAQGVEDLQLVVARPLVGSAVELCGLGPQGHAGLVGVALVALGDREGPLLARHLGAQVVCEQGSVLAVVVVTEAVAHPRAVALVRDEARLEDRAV